MFEEYGAFMEGKHIRIKASTLTSSRKELFYKNTSPTREKRDHLVKCAH